MSVWIKERTMHAISKTGGDKRTLLSARSQRARRKEQQEKEREIWALANIARKKEAWRVRKSSLCGLKSE